MSLPARAGKAEAVQAGAAPASTGNKAQKAIGFQTLTNSNMVRSKATISWRGQALASVRRDEGGVTVQQPDEMLSCDASRLQAMQDLLLVLTELDMRTFLQLLKQRCERAVVRSASYHYCLAVNVSQVPSVFLGY